MLRFWVNTRESDSEQLLSEFSLVTPVSPPITQGAASISHSAYSVQVATKHSIISTQTWLVLYDQENDAEPKSETISRPKCWCPVFKCS